MRLNSIDSPFYRTFPRTFSSLFSVRQKQFLEKLKSFFQENLSTLATGEEMHERIYDVTQTLEIKPKEAFEALYLIFIGKKQGPRLGAFLLALDKPFIIGRLERVCYESDQHP